MQMIAHLLVGAPIEKISRHLKTYVALSVVGALMSMPTQAQTQQDIEDENSTQQWQEIAASFPPTPQSRDLVVFYVSASAVQTFAIDEKSLVLGSDGIIRYTVVSTSPSGAKNIRYEGIRCASSERKLYATGRADGTWSPALHSQWEPILNNTTNRIEAALAQDYLCVGNSIAGTPKDMLRRIRRHEPMTQELVR
jgi:hypothetical protein